MNILFYRYGSICEEDLLRCFKESGHKCTTIDEEISDKTITGADSVRLVDKALSGSSYDCVFTVNFYPSISDLCNIYHIRYISWIVDSPVMELFSVSIKNQWNRVFVFDRAQYDEIKDYNPSCIFHYPLAVDTDSKQKIIQKAVADGIADRYRCGISFVGSLYSEKDPLYDMNGVAEYAKGYIEGLCEAQLRVYGYWFAEERLNDRAIEEFRSTMPGYYHMKTENFLTDRMIIGQYYMGNHITALERQRLISGISANLPVDVYTRSDPDRIKSANCRGGCETLTEMPLIFHESGINLNPTSKAIRSGIPLRVFDIFGCEGFMLSNYQPELCELFTPGEDFIFYDSIEQAEELIAYYSEHNKECSEIAHNAYLKVKDNYSYMVRLNRLLLTAFES